ncbi:hypothetical protein FQA39_LY08007 [Lamprigera yunnana]|nr:hypothetical protein FQA39_LY08007 [Lamprigera yunnana]
MQPMIEEKDIKPKVYLKVSHFDLNGQNRRSHFKMKLLIACVFCFSSVFAWTSNYHRQQTFEEWDKLFAIHRDECIKESGIYKEDAYDMEKIVTFPNYYGFKCYLKCQYNRLQFIDAEGLPNAAKLTGLGAGVDEEMITKCLPEILHTTNECDKSYNFARCLYEVMSGFNDN